MDLLIACGVFLALYLLSEVRTKLDRLSGAVSEQAEKLSTIEEKLLKIQIDLENVEAAIETITPDSARVDELVRLGFDRGDAWEHILTSKGDVSS